MGTYAGMNNAHRANADFPVTKATALVELGESRIEFVDDSECSEHVCVAKSLLCR